MSEFGFAHVAVHDIATLHKAVHAETAYAFFFKCSINFVMFLKLSWLYSSTKTLKYLPIISGAGIWPNWRTPPSTN